MSGRAKRLHPRVKCFNCGEPVGRMSGTKWERAEKLYYKWVELGCPDYLPQYDGLSDTPEHKAYRERWELVGWAHWYENRLKGKGKRVPPNCSPACHYALLKKKGEKLVDDKCVICRTRKVQYAYAFCSKICGSKFMVRAMRSQFSFEVV